MDDQGKIFDGINQQKQARDTGLSREGAIDEVMADACEEMLLDPEKVLGEFAKVDKGLAQRIKDFIGEWLTKLKSAITGTHREAVAMREYIDELQQKWGEGLAKALTSEDAETTENAVNEDGGKWSIAETTDGDYVAVVDNDILSNLNTSTWDKAKIKTAKKAAYNALSKFRSGIYVAGTHYKVNRDTAHEYIGSKDTAYLANTNKAIFADKMRFADVADDVIKATTAWTPDGGLNHQRKDNFTDFEHGLVLLMSGNNKYIAEVVVGVKANSERVFYDVVNLEPTSFEIETASDTVPYQAKPVSDINTEAVSKGNVTQSTAESQAKFSREDAENPYINLSYAEITDVKVQATYK